MPHRLRKVIVAVLAVAATGLLPDPSGASNPLSILGWGLIGDPDGLRQALFFVAYGGCLVAVYSLVIYFLVRFVLARAGVALGPRGSE